MSGSCVTAFHVEDVRVVEIRERTAGPRRISVTVVGEIDHSTHALLHSALARTWEARPVAVLVDLRQVTFLNAGGLRALLLTSRTARLRGVPLVVRSGPGRVSRLLTMVGFGQQLLCSTEDVAGHATEPATSFPALHLVASPEEGGESTDPPQDVGAEDTGPPRRRPELRSVPVRCGVPPASGRISAERGPAVEETCPRCGRDA